MAKNGLEGAKSDVQPQIPDRSGVADQTPDTPSDVKPQAPPDPSNVTPQVESAAVAP